MKFPYHVYHNDVLYKPYEDVPIDEVKEEQETEVKGEEVAEIPVESSETPDNRLVYNKTIINRMKVNELKELAKQSGLTDVDDLSGADIKRELIKKFGL